MKVMILSRGYPSRRYKGNGVFEMDQAQALSQAGVDVVFAALDMRSLRRWRKWGFETKAVNGVKVYALNLPVGHLPRVTKRLVGYIGLRLLYRKIEREEGRPDLIHAHFYFQGYLAAKLKKISKIPLVLTEHSSDIIKDQIPQHIRKEAEEAYSNSDALIAVSSSLKVKIADLFKRNAIVVPNIVDTRAFSYQTNNRRRGKDIRFVSCGNLVPSKRHDLSIRAISTLYEEMKNISLCLIGEGTERKKLEALAFVLGCRDKIEFVGHLSREEVAARLHESDIFVLPSDYETFGLAYVEALASGLPVIATRCGGPEDFITIDNGVLINTDDKNALLQAMRDMTIRLNEYSGELISRLIKERFSSSKIVKEILSTYQSVIQKQEV